jgi:F-type H+-transporting ATPase subunit delta
MAAASDLGSLAVQYARAAYQHTTEGWLTDLHAVWDRLAATPGLTDRLDDAGRPFADRQADLDGAIPATLRGDVKNFLYALLKDSHIGLLPDVIADLTRFAERGPETLAAQVTSAVPLTAEEQTAFRQRIAATYGDRVDVAFRVDAAVLGGAIVQVGDKIIDGSVAGKLNALHSRLVAAR